MGEREERIRGEDERIVRESIKVEKERELLSRDGNYFRLERGKIAREERRKIAEERGKKRRREKEKEEK